MTPGVSIRASKSAFFYVPVGQPGRQDPAIPGHLRCSWSQLCHSSVLLAPHQPWAAVQLKAGAKPYLEDPAARRVAGDVLAGVEHAQRHAVEQDHQHAHPLEPPARRPVKEATDPDKHPPVATTESERFWSLKQGACQLLQVRFDLVLHGEPACRLDTRTANPWCVLPVLSAVSAANAKTSIK